MDFSLEIIRKDVGDVTILYLQGRLILTTSSMFRRAIQDLAASGRKKLVLHLARVKYFDSAGLGELVSSYSTISNQGGSIVLADLTLKFRDVLQITKLYTVFEVFDDDASAAKYLDISPLHGRCPICGHRSSPALIDESVWQPQTCTNAGCGARFAIAGSTSGQPDRIESARLETYPGEYCEVTSGLPYAIVVAGRLNLFTSSALIKLYNALPGKIALFDLRMVTEITPEGRDALLKLAIPPGEKHGAVISLEGLPPDQMQLSFEMGPVYPDHASAIVALGGLVEKTPPWPARFEETQEAR